MNCIFSWNKTGIAMVLSFKLVLRLLTKGPWCNFIALFSGKWLLLLLFLVSLPIKASKSIKPNLRPKYSAMHIIITMLWRHFVADSSNRLFRFFYYKITVPKFSFCRRLFCILVRIPCLDWLGAFNTQQSLFQYSRG